MARVRDVSRRSFLATVSGAGLLASAALILGETGAQARRRRATRMAVDADPRDPARPITPARPEPQPLPPPPPVDSDSGPTSDAQGRGRPPLRASRPGPAGRFVICPGNRRCPGRNR